MSKTLKKIIIMLLVLTMLFSVSAVTIGAVSSEAASSASNSTEGGGDAGGGSEQENQQSDSLTTGWCDVSYDASTNEITVVLTPDKSAILGINKSQVSELLAIVGEAVKNVALDDILDEFGGIEIIQGGLNAENVWEKALDAYLNNHYSDVVTDSNGNGSLSDERKMEFIKDALDSNGGTARVEDFADFVCSLVRAAVLVKPEIRDSLPDANGIDEYVENVLNTLLHNTIDGYIDTAVRDYIKYIKGEGAETDLTETIETYMHSLVEETVNEYVANIGNTSYEGDQLYKYLSDYIDSHIKTEAENAIRAYIEAKIRGTAVDSTSFVYATIEEYADDYIEACVKTYISNKLAGREPVAGSADALFKPYIEQFTKDYINDLAEKYIAEKEGGAAAPTDELNLMIQGEIDKFISTFVEDRFTEYKAYKLNPVGEKPDFYALIEEKVREEVIAHIVADSDGTVDEAAAAQKYDNGEIAASEYLTYINENDVKSYAKSNLSASDYQKAFDSFDEAEMNNVITTVFANLDDAKLQLILSGNNIDYDKVIASIAPPAEDPDRDTKIQSYINTIVGGIGFDDAVDDAIQNLDSQKRADLVEEMYEKLTDDEINDMISESIADFTDDDIDSLVTELVAIANDKLEAGEFDALLEKYLGFAITYAEIETKMADISHIVGTKYTDLLAELDEINTLKERGLAILELLNDVRIDIDEDGILEEDEAIFLFVEDYGKVFDVEKIIEIINNLPHIDELATMTEEEMKLSYKIGIETVFGSDLSDGSMDTEFTVTIKLGAGHDKVNKLFDLVSKYLTIDYDSETGMISKVDLILPEEFSKLVLKLCDSGKIPESIKKKVFEKVIETPDGVHAFITDFTIDDIIALIDYIDSKADLDGIIDRLQLEKRFGQDFFKDLDTEGIKAKVEEYQEYYLKFIRLIDELYAYYKGTGLGEGLDEGILGVYQGQGEHGAIFEFNIPENVENQNVDLIELVYDALAKVSVDKAEEVRDLLRAMLYNTTIKIDVAVKLQSEKIGKVNYYLCSEITAESVPESVGFLPAGADINFFAPATTVDVEGVTKHIIGWQDENGNPVEKMPDLQSGGTEGFNLIPIFAEDDEDDTFIPYITVKDKITGVEINSKTYDGNPLVLTVNFSGNPEISWFKDGESEIISNASSIEVANVSETGKYVCIVDYDGTEKDKELSVTVLITPAVIDLPSLPITWNDGNFTYGDSDIEVTVDEDSIPDAYKNIINLVAVSGNTATDAGDYTASAEFEIVNSNENYIFDGNINTISYTWSIAKKQYNENIISFKRNSSNTFYKYGEYHLITAVINDSVAKEVLSIAIGGKYYESAAGNYTATFRVTVKDKYKNNFEWSGPDKITHDWEITKQVIDLSEYIWASYRVEKDSVSGKEVEIKYPAQTFEFDYDAIAKRLHLDAHSDTGSALPGDIAKILIYSNAEATDANSYTATVRLNTEHEDYEAISKNYTFVTDGASVKMPASQNWQIKKLIVDTGNAKWPDDTSFEYDEREQILNLIGLPEGTSSKIEYEYYMLDDQGNPILPALPGAPTNVGRYMVKVKLNEDNTTNYEIKEDFSAEVAFVIKPKAIDASAKLSVNKYNYNGSERKVSVVYSRQLLEYIKAGIVVETKTGDLVATDAGEYSVNVKLVIDNANYCFSDGTKEFVCDLEWSINKFVLDAPTLDVSDTSFVYDETDKTVEIAISDNNYYKDCFILSIVEEGTTVKAKNAGTYYVNYKISLTDEAKAHYEFTEVSGKVEWKIEKATVDASGIAWDYEKPFVFNGNKFKVALKGVDETLINVEYYDTCETDVIGIHNARAVISLKDSANYVFVGSDNISQSGEIEYICEWRIVSSVIELTGLKWNEVEYIYDGTVKTAPTVDLSGVDEDIRSLFKVRYTNEVSATDAGTYTVTVIFELFDENYSISHDLANESCTWVIEKATYDMSGVTFPSKTFTKEDGKIYNLVISGELPAGVSVEYTGNGCSEIGEHTVTAKFKGDEKNYNPIKDMVATLTIVEQSGGGGDTPVIPPEPVLKNEHSDGDVYVKSETGISEEYTFNANKTDAYNNLDLSGIYGDGKKASLVVAYDIFFSKDKTPVSLTNKFVVRILIPEALRGSDKVLGVIHIKDDNTIEVIDSELISRDGDYIVFETTHFSVYAIVEITDIAVEPIVPPVAGDKEKAPPITIVLLVLLVILILFIVFIISRKINIRIRAKRRKYAQKFHDDKYDEFMPEDFGPIDPNFINNGYYGQNPNPYLNQNYYPQNNYNNALPYNTGRMSRNQLVNARRYDNAQLIGSNRFEAPASRLNDSTNALFTSRAARESRENAIASDNYAMQYNNRWMPGDISGSDPRLNYIENPAVNSRNASNSMVGAAVIPVNKSKRKANSKHSLGVKSDFFDDRYEDSSVKLNQSANSLFSARTSSTANERIPSEPIRKFEPRWMPKEDYAPESKALAVAAIPVSNAKASSGYPSFDEDISGFDVSAAKLSDSANSLFKAGSAPVAEEPVSVAEAMPTYSARWTPKSQYQPEGPQSLSDVRGSEKRFSRDTGRNAGSAFVAAAIPVSSSRKMYEPEESYESTQGFKESSYGFSASENAMLSVNEEPEIVHSKIDDEPEMQYASSRWTSGNNYQPEKEITYANKAKKEKTRKKSAKSSTPAFAAAVVPVVKSKNVSKRDMLDEDISGFEESASRLSGSSNSLFSRSSAPAAEPATKATEPATKATEPAKVAEPKQQINSRWMPKRNYQPEEPAFISNSDAVETKALENTKAGIAPALVATVIPVSQSSDNTVTEEKSVSRLNDSTKALFRPEETNAEENVNNAPAAEPMTAPNSRWTRTQKYQPESAEMLNNAVGENADNSSGSAKAVFAVAAVPAVKSKELQKLHSEDVSGYENSISDLQKSTDSVIGTTAASADNTVPPMTKREPVPENKYMPKPAAEKAEAAEKLEESAPKTDKSTNVGVVAAAIPVAAPKSKADTESAPEPKAKKKKNAKAESAPEKEPSAEENALPLEKPAEEEPRAISTPRVVIRNAMPSAKKASAKPKPVINVISMDSPEEEAIEEPAWDDIQESVADTAPVQESYTEPEVQAEDQAEEQAEEQAEATTSLESKLAAASEPMRVVLRPAKATMVESAPEVEDQPEEIDFDQYPEGDGDLEDFISPAVKTAEEVEQSTSSVESLSVENSSDFLDISDVSECRLIDGQMVSVRYRTSYTSRLIQSDKTIQDYYTAIKNHILSYKGIKARVSWNFESFNLARLQCVKLNVKGSTLLVYLALDTNEYSVSKYHFVNVSEKPKFDKVPMMLKVKSDRALKYALELIDEVMRKNGILQGEIPSIDYHMPYESTEELCDRELVKLILPEGIVINENTVIEKVDKVELLKKSSEAAFSEEKKIVFTDANTANSMITDEEADSFVEKIKHLSGQKPHSKKLYEVNLDTVCENFNDGDVVTVKALKEKRIISLKAERVKILARGVMNKKLTVVADKFSLAAIKMIALAGGLAEIYVD